MNYRRNDKLTASLHKHMFFKGKQYGFHIETLNYFKDAFVKIKQKNNAI